MSKQVSASFGTRSAQTTDKTTCVPWRYQIGVCRLRKLPGYFDRRTSSVRLFPAIPIVHNILHNCDNCYGPVDENVIVIDTNYNIYQPEVMEYYNIHGTSRVLNTRIVCGSPIRVRASVTASNGRRSCLSKFPHNESAAYQGLMSG